jgi:hypothetical protein
MILDFSPFSGLGRAPPVARRPLFDRPLSALGARVSAVRWLGSDLPTWGRENGHDPQPLHAAVPSAIPIVRLPAGRLGLPWGLLGIRVSFDHIGSLGGDRQRYRLRWRRVFRGGFQALRNRRSLVQIFDGLGQNPLLRSENPKTRCVIPARVALRTIMQKHPRILIRP